MSDSKKILLKRDFMKQAKLGNGKAYSIFMQNPKIDFTDCITELSLHNFAYDPQCEGDRADYALQFIRALNENQKKTVLDKIKKQLSETKITDDWDIFQLFTLAALLSKEYDSSFGKILVSRYENCSADELWNFPDHSIQLLEGFDGMIRIARRCGKMLLFDESWWVSSGTMFGVPKMDGLEVWGLEPIMFAYKNLSCGFCRNRVVEIMEKAGVLADEVRAEFQHDSIYLYNKREDFD